MKVLILAPFAPNSLERLAQFCEPIHEDWRTTGAFWDPVELGERLASEAIDAVFVERDFLFEETFDAARNLRFAGVCRAAVNQVDVDAATQHRVLVVNTPGRNANAVAELTIGLLFAVARRVCEADRYVRGGAWESPTDPYLRLRGFELAGRTFGVIGFGAIGRRVAAIAQALGMNVLAFDPYLGSSEVTAAGAEAVRLDALVSRCDIVSLHAPASSDGEPLLDSATLASMKRGAILLNTASAELVDSEALADALRNGRLAGAGYDIFETAPIAPGHPLLTLENVVLTPHIGGATDETIERHSQMLTEDLARWTRGERPHHLVNPVAWPAEAPNATKR